MAKAKKLDVNDLLSSIDQRLQSFGAEYADLDLREKVLRLVAIYDGVRALNVSVVRESGCDSRAALTRIKLYFLHNVGTVLSGKELEVVSGISEYARRIRELRVQRGFKILTGNSNDPEQGLELRPDEYVLTDPEPDREAAHRWNLVYEIRKKKIGAKGRILEFLKANVGKVVTREELAYVSGDRSEWARRTRELRTEMGYAVATTLTGRPDLKLGEYVLECLEPVVEAHFRDIPIAVQRKVYTRDNNMCQVCGWSRDLWTRQDPRFLELHHKRRHADGGLNTVENLVVVCSRCHDGIHAGTVAEDFSGPKYGNLDDD